MPKRRYVPGDLAVWHTGSCSLSWPPDGVRCDRMITPKVNTVVLVVAVTDWHGSIVLTPDRGVWWCPQASLRGEPSGSLRRY